ncbi:MAG: malate:quinone oxidoreductase [Methylobacterium frigidaeris]
MIRVGVGQSPPVEHLAGQRVQIIRRDPELGGVLEPGAEIMSTGDGSNADRPVPGLAP